KSEELCGDLFAKCSRRNDDKKALQALVYKQCEHCLGLASAGWHNNGGWIIRYLPVSERFVQRAHLRCSQSFHYDFPSNAFFLAEKELPSPRSPCTLSMTLTVTSTVVRNANRLWFDPARLASKPAEFLRISRDATRGHEQNFAHIVRWSNVF